MKNPLKNCSRVITHRHCPLCDCNEGFLLIDLYYALFDDSPLSCPMHLIACSDCGFIFYDTESEEPAFNAFYKDHYFIHAYGSNLHDYQRGHDTYQKLSELFKSIGLDASSSILDVGCGQGQLIQSLKYNGFENVAGLELCQDYVQHLISQGGEAYVGSALDIPLRNVDLLIYKHIFEHFYQVHNVMEKAVSSLSPEGYIFVAVPDSSRYGEFTDYSPLHFFTLEHINHFDLHHLEAIFAVHGMTLVHVSSQLLNIAEDYPVPILSCLFQKQSLCEKRKVVPDFDLAQKMDRWLISQNTLATERLEYLRKSQKKVYIWGLSYRTSMYLAMSPLKKCNIQGFFDIDERKQKKTLLKKKVFSPDKLMEIDKDSAVVIGVGPSSKSMTKYLLEKGFCGEIIRLI